MEITPATAEIELRYAPDEIILSSTALLDDVQITLSEIPAKDGAFFTHIRKC